MRIEDTDRERFVEDGEKCIIESLKWLGIEPDNLENYPVQSKRLETYKKHAFDLVRAGHAYICTCSKEKLAQDHERQLKENRPPRYEGHCRTADMHLKDLKDGCYVIRMKMPDNGKTVVGDMIRGDVEFENKLIDDQIILKSDGFPTYHLAVVVDDSEMGITHVIRGEEWLSSTPKHLLLYKYFGWEPPKYAHLPVILGPDKKKLSKRHGAASLLEYQQMGYLPEAMINFLALLGWNPKDEREEFILDELEKEFKLENVNKSPAVFDIDKLKSINAFYLKSQISKLKTTTQISNFLAEFGISELSVGELELIGRGGYQTLVEAAEYIKKLRKEPIYESKLLIFRNSDKERCKKGLEAALEVFEAIPVDKWKLDDINKALIDIVAKNQLSNGDVFWPVRVALSGEEKSPSPAEIAVAIGRENTINRLQKAINIV